MAGASLGSSESGSRLLAPVVEAARPTALPNFTTTTITTITTITTTAAAAAAAAAAIAHASMLEIRQVGPEGGAHGAHGGVGGLRLTSLRVACRRRFPGDGRTRACLEHTMKKATTRMKMTMAIMNSPSSSLSASSFSGSSGPPSS